MNHCSIQNSAFAAYDGMRGSLVRPQPRRIRPLSSFPDPLCPLSWQTCNQADALDLKAAVEFDNIFLAKDSENQVEPSSPFCIGSPPPRSANPLINDACFMEVTSSNPIHNPNPVVLTTSVHVTVPMPASTRSGCANTTNNRFLPAVRVDGFDCLDRDRSRRITAFA